jgi:sugar/nucleoside kinase (ribokinase family)
MSFARAAAAHFEQVRVLAAIGNDEWNPAIWEAAHRLGVEAFFEEQPDMPNGLVVIVRDAPTHEHPSGVRLLLAQQPSPYDRLDTGVVARWAGLIASSDAVVVDGYALLHERSAAAVALATDLAVRAGVPVCFDLVPHRIDERVPAREIWPLLRRASMRIAEAPTLARLQGLPPPPHACAGYAADLVSRLEDDATDLRHTWFVRFGVGMMEETVAIGTWHQSAYYHTGYAREADGSGFGYRVAAAELKWWLANAVPARR